LKNLISMLKLSTISVITCIVFCGWDNYFPVKNHEENERVVQRLHNDTGTSVSGSINDDTLRFSKLFIDQIEKSHKSYQFKDDNLIVNSRVVKFPTNLIIDTEYRYHTWSREIDYYIVIKRINKTDITYRFTEKNSDSLLYQRSDTVTLYPFQGESIKVKYGYSSGGDYYLKETNEGSTEVIIDYMKGNFLTFRYTHFANDSPEDRAIRKMVSYIPTLYKENVLEPYPEYIKALIDNLSEAKINLIENEKKEVSDDQTKKQYYFKYYHAYNDLEKLLSEIKNRKILDVIKNDTLALDLANFYGLDSVITLLKNNGVEERARISFDQDEQVPVSRFYQLQGSVFMAYPDKVLSNRFEKYNTDKREIYSKYIPCLWEYGPYEKVSKPIQFNNVYVSLMPYARDNGAPNIITVWKRQMDKYSLVSILDRSIQSGYMGASTIDTIVYYRKNENIIIGHSSGGDENDVYGSLWIALWKLPREFRVLYMDGWGGVSEDYTYLESNVLDRMTIEVTKKRKLSNQSGDNWIKTDSTISKHRILIDTLINNFLNRRHDPPWF
jgi:hypothetical protein